MPKYLAQSNFDSVKEHLKVLQQTLSANEPDGGLLSATRANQTILDAVTQLNQLTTSTGSMYRHIEAFISVLERIPNGIIVLDENGRLLVCNGTAEKLLGIEGVSEQWPGVVRVFDSDTTDAPSSPSALPPIYTAQSGQPSEREFFVRAGGSGLGRWIKMVATPVFVAGTRAGAIALIEDITKDKLDQQLMSEFQPYVANVAKTSSAQIIIENASQAFLAIDVAGIITDWNMQAEVLLGYSSAEAVGRNMRDLVVPARFIKQFDASMPQIMERAQRGAALARMELPAVSRDGRERIMEVAPFAISRMQKVCAFFDDITPRVRAEQRRNARDAVAATLAESFAFDDAHVRLLTGIGSCIAWDCGLLWMVDRRSNALRLAESWFSRPDFDGFIAENHRLAIRPREGMLGRVWSNGQCEWLEDLSVVAAEPQRNLSTISKVRTTFAFPVVTIHGVEAVFQFFSEQGREIDEDMLLFFADIGKQIGRYVDAQRSIRDRYRLVASIVDAAEDAMISLSLDGKISSWNHGAAGIYGYQPSDIIGHDATMLFPVDQENEAQELIAAAVSTRKQQHIDTKNVTSAHEVFDVSVSVTPVLDSSGELYSLCLIARKRERADTASGAHEPAKLGELSEELDVRQKELETIDRYVADKRSNLDALSDDMQIKEQQLTVLVSELQKYEQNLQEMAEAIRQKEDKLVQLSNNIEEKERLDVFDDLERKEQAASAGQLKDQQQRLDAVMEDLQQRAQWLESLNKDVHQKEQLASQLEEELRARHEKLHAAEQELNQRQQELQLVHSQISEKEAVLGTNDEQRQALERADAEVESTLAQLNELRKQLAETQQRLQTVESDLTQKHSKLQTIDTHLQQKQDRLAGVLSELEERMLEISRAKQALSSAKELAASQPAPDAVAPPAPPKADFLSRMSKEFRTPLSAIINLSQTIATNSALAEEMREFVNIIHESGVTLSNAFNEFVELSQIESGQVQLNLTEFTLSEVLDKAADHQATQAEAKGLSLTTFVSPDVASKVRGDREKLQKILNRLLEETLKYKEKGGVVLRAEVAKEEGGKQVLKLSLNDMAATTGMDRPQTHRDSILLDTTCFDSSHDLGMSIIKQLIAAMGGQVGVEQTNSKAGNSFWLTMPFEIVETPSEKDELSGTRILVVDGPTGASRMINAFCESRGAHPEFAQTSDEAVNILRRQVKAKNPYDAVVIESIVFGMSGQALATEIREYADLDDTAIVLVYPSKQEPRRMAQLEKLVNTSVLQGPLKQRAFLDEIKRVRKNRPSAAQEPAVASSVVLVVESNKINRKLIELQLSALGVTAQVVTNGREALAAARKVNCALILLDCELPDMDGFTAARAIRTAEGARHTAIVGMTANPLETQRQKCLDAGMDDCLSKPVDAQKLTEIIAKYKQDSSTSAGSSAAAAAATPPAKVEPSPAPASAAQMEPVAAPAPVPEAEPVAKAQPVVAPAPVPEAEPVAKAQPVAAPVAVPEAEPVVAPESVSPGEPDAVAQRGTESTPESVVTHEQEPETEPVSDHTELIEQQVDTIAPGTFPPANPSSVQSDEDELPSWLQSEAAQNSDETAPAPPQVEHNDSNGRKNQQPTPMGADSDESHTIEIRTKDDTVEHAHAAAEVTGEHDPYVAEAEDQAPAEPHVSLGELALGASPEAATEPEHEANILQQMLGGEPETPSASQQDPSNIFQKMLEAVPPSALEQEPDAAPSTNDLNSLADAIEAEGEQSSESSLSVQPASDVGRSKEFTQLQEMAERLIMKTNQKSGDRLFSIGGNKASDSYLLDLGEEESTEESSAAEATATNEQEVAAAEQPSQSSDAGGNGDDAQLEMDLSRLRRICGDFGMREIIEEFVGSSKEMMQDLEQAIQNRDPAERRRIAHELNGSCDALGAKQLQDLTMQIQLLDDNDWSSCDALYDALKQSFVNLLKALQPHLVA